MAEIDVEKRNTTQQILVKNLKSSRTNKIIETVLNDLSSKKKQGFSLSFSTKLKLLRFIISNPLNSYNLFKAALNVKDDTEIQNALLEKQEIWSFFKKHADNLPKIGQILEKFGFKEFEEGNILDQAGLNKLKIGFSNDQVLGNLKKIATEIRKEAPDMMKVTSETLEMLSNDDFKPFFKTKGQNIADYLYKAVTEVTPEDYIKSFDDILQKVKNKEKYSAIIKKFDQDEKFRQYLAENINTPEELEKLIKQNPKLQFIKEFLNEAKEQATTMLGQNFKTYNIDPEILNVIPASLENLPKIKKIFDSLNKPKEGVMVAVEKSLEMIANDAELKEFFTKNPQFLPNMASGIIDNTPNLKNTVEDYRLDKEMLKIVGVVMSKPEVAYKTVKDLNKGDYFSLTSNLISNLNDSDLKLKDLLVKQSKDGLFDNLIQGVLEQDKKGDKTIHQQLMNYGIEGENISKLTKVMLLLLNNPESLQKVFTGSVKGDYTSMAKELITLTKNNSEIKQYLNDNSEIFVKILDKVLVDVPGINNLDKKELYKIIPSMLNHPDELNRIIEGVEKKNYTGAASALYNLAQKTNYFEGQLPKLAGAGIGVGVNYVVQKVSNIFSNINNDFKGKTIDSVTFNNIMDRVKKGEVKLEGAILEGDLSNVDFSGVSLKNADLTKVTSFKNSNLKDTNFEGAKLPDNLNLLTDTYNLDKTNPHMSSDLIKGQQSKLIDKAVDKVFLQAQTESIKNLPNKERFTQKIKNLCQVNPEIKDYIVEKLNSVSMSSIGDIPPKMKQFKHVSEHTNSPLQVLTPLYENMVNGEDLKSNLVANILSEQVTNKLFGKGDNRGKDFHMIQEMIKDVICEHAEHVDVADLLEQKNQETLVNEITNILYSKSKHTLAGAITGGIYLPEEIFDELKNNLTNTLKSTLEKNTTLPILVEAKNIASNVSRKFKVVHNLHHLDSKSSSNFSRNQNLARNKNDNELGIL